MKKILLSTVAASLLALPSLAHDQQAKDMKGSDEPKVHVDHHKNETKEEHMKHAKNEKMNKNNKNKNVESKDGAKNNEGMEGTTN